MSFSSGESDMEMEAEVEEQNPGLDSPSLCVQQKQRASISKKCLLGKPKSPPPQKKKRGGGGKTKKAPRKEKSKKRGQRV